ASQVTQHERQRYWVAEAHRGEPPAQPAWAADFLTRPPADTPVLLGYVKNQAHLAWIKARGLYNLRADGRTGSVGLQAAELGTELVVLYSPALPKAEVWRGGEGPQVLSRRRMMGLGDPTPRGELYICLPVEPVVGEWSARLSRETIEGLRARVSPDTPYGAPVVTTWLEVAEVSGQI